MPIYDTASYLFKEVKQIMEFDYHALKRNVMIILTSIHLYISSGPACTKYLNLRCSLSLTFPLLKLCNLIKFKVLRYMELLRSLRRDNLLF